MSVESQESIYNLIPPSVPPLQKQARYRSKFKYNVKQETRRNLAGSKTMVRSAHISRVVKLNPYWLLGRSVLSA